MFIDVTEQFQRFRSLLQTVWNGYMWQNFDRDWDTVDHFNTIRSYLIDRLLLDAISRQMDLAEVSAFVVPRLADRDFLLGAPIRISETLETQGSRDWNQPPVYITKDEMILTFKDFFDWGQCGYRDFHYFLVEIRKSDKYPDLVGREALLEVGYCAVVAVDASCEAKEIQEALKSFWPS